jgi:hypothetical protein
MEDTAEDREPNGRHFSAKIPKMDRESPILGILGSKHMKFRILQIQRAGKIGG